MNERRDEERLTTADVAAAVAAERRDRDPEPAAGLFPAEEGERLRHRWSEIQTGFVDEPRQAVEQADGLVATVMQRLAQGFSDERSRLEAQWGRGDNISTEDLRQVLRRYRMFFDRLLSI